MTIEGLFFFFFILQLAFYTCQLKAEIRSLCKLWPTFESTIKLTNKCTASNISFRLKLEWWWLMIVQCDLSLLDLKVEERRAKTKSEDLLHAENDSKWNKKISLVVGQLNYENRGKPKWQSGRRWFKIERLRGATGFRFGVAIKSPVLKMRKTLSKASYAG